VSLIRKIREVHQIPSLQDSLNSGSTACVVAYYQKTIYCANVGDSRAVLSVQGCAEPLSFDHKPDNPEERARIEAAGGRVRNGRIDNGLNMSRALGDLGYKQRAGLPPEKQMVTAEPDVCQVALGGREEFLFVGCDGVWEQYEKDEQGLVSRVNALRRSHPDRKELLSALLEGMLSPRVG
jgi:protein phosphatase PTC2/3